jgi:hypothetical protein
MNFALISGACYLQIIANKSERRTKGTNVMVGVVGRIAGAILGALALAGCNAAGETYYARDHARGAAVPGVSVDAKQRFVWTPTVPVRSLTGVDTSGRDIYGVRDRSIVCAEPSPDAVSAFASEFSAAVKVALPKANVDASIARSIAESVQSLTQRTEMLQLLRDGYYRICEAYANGMVGEFGYALVINQIDNIIVKLVAINAIREHRPLPADPADREKLAASETAQAALVGAQTRHARAHADLDAAIGRRDAAIRRSAEAKAAEAGAEKLANELSPTEVIDKAPEAERPALRERRRSALIEKDRQSQIHAGANLERDKAAEDLAAAQTRLGLERTALVKAEEEVDKSSKAAAAVLRAPFAVEALQAIERIVEASNPGTTLAGACAMWLSQRPQITRTATNDEPLVAAACRRALGVDAAGGPMAGTPANAQAAAVIGALREAETAMFGRLIEHARRGAPAAQR